MLYLSRISISRVRFLNLELNFPHMYLSKEGVLHFMKETGAVAAQLRGFETATQGDSVDLKAELTDKLGDYLRTCAEYVGHCDNINEHLKADEGVLTKLAHWAQVNKEGHEVGVHYNLLSAVQDLSKIERVLGVAFNQVKSLISDIISKMGSPTIDRNLLSQIREAAHELEMKLSEIFQMSSKYAELIRQEVNYIKADVAWFNHFKEKINLEKQLLASQDNADSLGVMDKNILSWLN